jgi:hypothetical protein
MKNQANDLKFNQFPICSIHSRNVLPCNAGVNSSDVQTL